MMTDPRKALLIVVTFNSYDALTDVISAVRLFKEDHPGNHVVVVENSSDSRIYERIKSTVKSDKILVEVASSNSGFSHGVNLGYRLAQDKWGKFNYVVLLNPDVVCAGHTVCELVNRAAADSEPDAGLWGAVLKDQCGRIDRGCARRVWNRRRFFSHLAGYPNFAKILHTAPRGLTAREIQDDQSQLAMVSGALMCISAEVFDEGLDTHLPMYLEDQEICLRCLAKGYTVHLYSDLEAVHVGGTSRKSITDHEHALRVMELVESPVQCMSRLQGYGLFSMRLTVLMGGLSRLAAGPLIVAYRTLVHRKHISGELAWLSEQRRLATWFVRWAINGKFHTNEVSLDEYFQEYTAVR